MPGEIAEAAREVGELRRKLKDALASSDLWQRRHAESERKLEMKDRLLRDARREIGRLQEDLTKANERIVRQNQLIAERIAG
jgi:chromosome segregation ATPase